MVESLERKFEFPETLQNVFETEDVRYIGEATKLHFYGKDILGKPSLKKYTGEEPLPSFSVSALYDHERFIVDGKPRRQRSYGYRQELVSKLANIGINISDELLNEVFGPIEDELMRLYLQVFPPEEEEGKINTIQGVVNNVWSGEVGIHTREVTFYTIVYADGNPHRVAISGTQDNLKVGEKVTLDFDEDDVVARDTKYSTIETYPGQFQVAKSSTKWFRVKGYKKTDEEKTPELGDDISDKLSHQ